MVPPGDRDDAQIHALGGGQFAQSGLDLVDPDGVVVGRILRPEVDDAGPGAQRVRNVIDVESSDHAVLVLDQLG